MVVTKLNSRLRKSKFTKLRSRRLRNEFCMWSACDMKRFSNVCCLAAVGDSRVFLRSDHATEIVAASCLIYRTRLHFALGRALHGSLAEVP